MTHQHAWKKQGVAAISGKLRDVQRACVGLDELLREVEP